MHKKFLPAGLPFASCALFAAVMLFSACATVTYRSWDGNGGRFAESEMPVSAPDAEGFDATALAAVLARVRDGAANIHSVLVARHGKIVAELYRKGWDAPIGSDQGRRETVFDAMSLHDARSVSKSVTSMLAGIVFEKAGISPDTPVLSFFADKNLAGGGREKVTIRTLLTMSSGLRWEEWDRAGLASDELRLFWDTDPVAYYFGRGFTAEPGSYFNYSGGSTQVLERIITHAGGKSFEEMLDQYLFGPLGIRNWEWLTGTDGEPFAFAGLRIRPRDMLKLGQLMLDGGMWNGTRLIDPQWVADSLTPHIQTGIDRFSVDGKPLDYGYQWWLGNVDWKGSSVPWASAVGNGGQRIYVIPSLDMVCVVTSGDYGIPAIQDSVNRVFSDIVAAAK